MVVVVISGFVFLQAAAVVRRLAAVDDGGSSACVSCFMQVVASLTVDLDNWAAVADNIVGRYLSWWLYFGVVSVGGGARGGCYERASFSLYFWLFWV
jgi:hypothetical protein